mgnify:CR=1 FL=1
MAEDLSAFQHRHTPTAEQTVFALPGIGLLIGAQSLCLYSAVARLPVPDFLRRHVFKGKDPAHAQKVIAADLVVLKQAFEVLQSQGKSVAGPARKLV